MPTNRQRKPRLFEAAGWRDTDGDGIRDRDGRPFRFTAKTNASQLTDAVLLQSQLRRVGIQMEIQTGQFGWGTVEDGDYEAYFFAIRFHEPTWLTNFRIPMPGYYHNPRLIELIDEALATRVAAEVDSIYSEIGEIFRRDLPLTYLYPFVFFTVADRRLRGLKSPHVYDVAALIPELWLER